MPKHPPAFQFYANDFVTGTSRLTTPEVGGYILLLCEQWDKGSIPGDSLKALAQIMRCTSTSARSIWQSIEGKFVRGEDGQWRNARLERVRAEQLAYRAKQAANGSKGGRRVSQVEPSDNPPLNPALKPPPYPNITSPNSGLQSSPDQHKERVDLLNTRTASFDRFWAVYPKRKAKADAMKAWTALKPDSALVEKILDAVREQSRSVDWLKEGGKWIPYPASWLRSARWEDEAVELPHMSDKTTRTMEAILGTN